MVQAPGERVDAGGPEEMVVGEIDADQADARGPHVDGKADRDIGRVPRVVQHIRVREVDAAIDPERDGHSRHLLQSPIGVLGENGAGAALRDRAPPIQRELRGRVDYDEIVGVEVAADVIDADCDATGLDGKVLERRSAAAHYDGLAAMPTSEVGEGLGDQPNSCRCNHCRRPNTLCCE